MKRMILITVATFLFALGAVNAQDKVEVRAQAAAEVYKTHLTLTDQQVQQIVDVEKKMLEDMKPLRKEKKDGLPQEEFKTKKKAIMKEYRKDIRKILNKEQVAAWKEKKDQINDDLKQAYKTK